MTGNANGQQTVYSVTEALVAAVENVSAALLDSKQINEDVATVTMNHALARFVL